MFSRFALKRSLSTLRHGKFKGRRKKKSSSVSQSLPVFKAPIQVTTQTTQSRSYIPWIVGGSFLYVAATGIGFLYWQSRPSPETDACSCTSVSEKRRREAYDCGAATYDADVGWHETASQITNHRRKLLENARGKVLEVAAGTARNLKFYPLGCKVTFTDCSEKMIDIAKQKVAKERLVESNVAENAICKVMDADNILFPDNHFDTVVDTFGVCSFEDPLRTLREIKRVCKPDGRILLLEHGKSHWNWLTRLMNRYAAKHASRWGCWWNRDIIGIVNAADLEVLSCSTHQAGTLYIIIAKP